jgi:anti-anti-sigma factor
MSEKPESNADCVTLKASGDFSFSLNDVFKQALQLYPKGECCFAIDLSDVHQIDSSALGMMLQLREHSRQGVKVRLVNPRPAIMGLLREAGYPDLFDIVET